MERLDDGRLTWEGDMYEVMVHEVGTCYANLDDGQFIYTQIQMFLNESCDWKEYQHFQFVSRDIVVPEDH